jgi:hypothetical protein
VRLPFASPPPLRVELARNALSQAPAWEDVTLRAAGSGVTIQRGRPSQYEASQPSRCSLTLDSSDGALSDVAGQVPALFGKRLRVTVRDSLAPANLAPNPEFVGGSTTGWGGTAFGYAGTSTLAASTLRYVAASGRSLLVTWPTQAAATAAYTTIPTVIGRKYEAVTVVWVSSGPAVKLQDLFGTAGGTSTATGAWQVLRVRWTATAAAHYIGITTSATTAGQAVHVGALRVDEGWSAAPLVGSYTSLAAAGYVSTPFDSVTTYRFTGTIVTGALGWHGSLDLARIPVTAVDRSARLGSRTLTFRGSGPQETLSQQPYGYWPLGEPAGATSAGDLSMKGRKPFTFSGAGSAAAFGSTVATATSADTGATFAAGKYLRGTLDGVGYVTDAASLSVVARSSLAADQVVAALGDAYGARWVLRITSGGKARAESLDPYDWSGNARPSATSTANVNDGQPHHLHLQATRAAGTMTLRLYVDGALADTVSQSGWAFMPTAYFVTAGGGWKLPGLTGMAAHVAVWDRALTATEITDQAAGHLNGFTGEVTNYRLARYARWAGIPQGDLVLDDDTAYRGTMAHVDTEDMSPWDAMTLCETVEGGALGIDGAGRIRFRSRGADYNQPAQATIPAAMLRTSLSYVTDASRLVNDLRGARPGGAQQRTVNEASIADYGRVEVNLAVPADSDEQVSDLLSWRIVRDSEPRPRAEGVSVRLTQCDDTLTAALLGVEVGDRVDITGLPSQAPASTDSLTVQGWTETYSLADGATWSADTDRHIPVLKLDDATFGVLDAYPLAY